MRYVRLTLALAIVVAFPTSARAQSLRQGCTGMQSPSYRTLCENVADAVLIVQPNVGIVASGGNPVPGTASTLGMRLGALPRISLAARTTGTFVDVPQIERASRTHDIDFAAATIDADASVGVFQGFTLLPTVGGFGAIDLLASAGVVLTRRDSFQSSPFTWSAGVRLGLLRESFTAPGVSISAMYRKIGDVEYGNLAADPHSGEDDAFFRLNDYQVTSWRGVVGKRLLGFGLAAGLGHDRYRSGVLIRVRDSGTLPPAPTQTREFFRGGVKTSRTAVFGNASYTILLLSIVLEGGYQFGGATTSLQSHLIGENTLFGGLALRIGI